MTNPLRSDPCMLVLCKESPVVRPMMISARFLGSDGGVRSSLSNSLVDEFGHRLDVGAVQLAIGLGKRLVPAGLQLKLSREKPEVEIRGPSF